MRDHLKNEEFFRNAIAKEEKNIALYESAYETVVAKDGEESRGAQNGIVILIHGYDRLLNLQYSAGEPLEEVRSTFVRLLQLYGKSWKRENGYIELIKVLSLAELFEVNISDLSRIEACLNREKMDDWLVNTLLADMDPEWLSQGEEFEYPGIYERLKEISEAGDQAPDLLKKYLREEWYSLHNECAWYNSHKSKRNTYTGYWSFEAAAIAKIFSINDAGMEKEPYYPYDLVHYLE